MSDPNEKIAKTILLVEDEAIIALSEKRQLEAQGYGVLVAHSGEKAVEAVEAGYPLDLILMDINLKGGIDGTEAARKILRLRDIPVVFLSSHAEPEIVSKTEAITSYGYVLKGSSITVLDASIKMAFKLFYANQEIRKSSAIIQERNQLLETIIEGFPGTVFWKDRNLVYLGCNTAIARDAGLESPADVVGKSDEELGWGSRLVDFFRSTDRKVLQSGLPVFHIEESYERADGRIQQYETSKFPLVDAEGRVSGVFGVSIDVTELKEAQERLVTSNEMLKKILDSIPQFIVWKNRKSEFLGCNDNFAHFFGMSDTRSMVGKTDWDLGMNKGETENYTSDDRWVMERDTPKYHIIEKNTDANGREVWLDTNKIPLHDAEGKVNGILVAFSDITQRWEAQKALMESENLYLSILTASPDGIAVTDLAGGIVMVSPVILSMFGYAREDLIGRSIADFVVIEDRDRALATIARLARGEGIELGEYGATRDDGSHVIIEANGGSVRDAAGEISKIMFVIRDITERKQREEKIAALLEEKDLILKEVHHRIKNNMGTIQSLLTLQAGAMKDSCAVSSLEDAAERVQSMMVLYDKLYQSSSFTAISVKEYIPALAEQIVSNFPAAGSIRLDADVADFTLSSKTLQPLGIIINELITNAMKYAFAGRDGGRIQISAKIDDRRVAIEIADDGVGIPASIDFEKSPGFGLMLVKNLAEQLKGRVRLERGAGTTFVLEFNA
jgi:PAS domain S-box-containing protein